MTSKPSKKVTKAPKLSANFKKGKNISLKTSDITITKYVDASSPK